MVQQSEWRGEVFRQGRLNHHHDTTIKQCRLRLQTTYTSRHRIACPKYVTTLLRQLLPKAHMIVLNILLLKYWTILEPNKRGAENYNGV